jgi:hypothetical protein
MNNFLDKGGVRMNFLSLKNRKGMSGAVKGAMVILTLAFVVASVSYIVPVFAAHTATVTITPDIANCNQLGNIFTVTVKNNEGSQDSIWTVDIYKSTGVTIFSCRDPPLGWYLANYSNIGLCRYTASDISNFIAPGSQLDFTFNAVMTSGPGCDRQFHVATLDNHTPTGEYQHSYPTVSVDCNLPVIVKSITSGNYQGVCPPNKQNPGDLCWISGRTIHVTAYDNATCDLGLDYCEWSYTVDGVDGQSGKVSDNGVIEFDVTFEEDSVHVLNITCVDDAGNREEDIETFKVDSTPPETTKDIEPDPYIKDGAEYIDTVNEITLTAQDGGPICSIDVDKTWYKNILAGSRQYGDLDEEACETPEVYCKVPVDFDYCLNCPDGEYPDECIDIVQEDCADLRCSVHEPAHEYKTFKECVEAESYKRCCGGWDWKLYDGTPIQKNEESCHILYYFSVDELGNVEPIDVNCFFVDKTPPVLEKIVGEPKLEEPDLEMLGNGKAYWVTSQFYSGDSSAKLIIPDDSAGTDFAGVDSFFDVFVELDDIESLSYYRKVIQFDNGWNPILILGVDVDNDGKFEAQPLEWEASWNGASFNPALLGDDSFIQCEATDGLSAIDAAWVKVDAYNNFKCYTPNKAGDNYDSAYELLSYFQENAAGRIEPEDEIAMVKIELGGNPTTQDNEIAYVDYVEMNGKIIIDEPQGFTWVNSDTEITFTCTDPQPHPSGDEELCFKVSYDVPTYLTYITEQYCDPQNMENGWCCVDASPETPEDGSPFVFNFKKEEYSLHNLEYFCRDAVDKKSDTYIQYYRVYAVPEVTKEMFGTYQGQCPPQPYNSDDKCYITDGSGVDILFSEPEAHGCLLPITCTYQVEYPEGNVVESGEFSDDKRITLTGDSEHILTIDCVDDIGNTAFHDVETFLVDKEPPVTTKTYGRLTEVEGGYRWITSSTPVYFTPDDEKVGTDKLYWRNTLLSIPDEDCVEACNYDGSGEWNTEDIEEGDTVTIYKPDESCHLIEFYAVDELGNVEDTQKQCVFVDNTGPNPVKTVGEPKDVWTPGENGDPASYFYPEETEDCGDGIDCWEATTVTPILMECEDPTPHPVGEKKICFKVDVDGEDETNRYCRKYGGWYNWISGYCCRWLGREDGNDNHDNCEFFDYNDHCDEVQDIECYDGRKLFYFLEDTEHNLKYYCVDKLGNKGPVDEEKFKIEGNRFEIPLFKKWNLISVPFTLLNETPEVIFDKIYFDGEQVENIEDYIDSVWTYDPELSMCGKDWCVWSPDDDTPDNLKIKPGWGYWVMVSDKPEEECGGRPKCFWYKHNEEPLWMVIGGSLFSPATTPPSRELLKGWNLIGYYGTNWEEYDRGDFDFMCGDQYGHWWEPDKWLYGDKVYCALNSLIDTQEGYPRWSSLWSYINCGNHNTNWLGLNACIDPSPFITQDRMYAGRGYWLELDVPDIYAPATTCIWNSDFQCVWTGGGLFS